MFEYYLNATPENKINTPACNQYRYYHLIIVQQIFIFTKAFTVWKLSTYPLWKIIPKCVHWSLLKRCPEFKFPPKILMASSLSKYCELVPVYFIKGSNKCNFSMPLKKKIFLILYHFLLYTASFNMTFNNGLNNTESCRFCFFWMVFL